MAEFRAVMNVKISIHPKPETNTLKLALQVNIDFENVHLLLGHLPLNLYNFCTRTLVR